MLKNRIIQIIFIFGSVIIYCLLVSASSDIAEETPVTLNIDMSKSNIVEIMPDTIYGVNSNFFQSPEKLDDPYLWKLYRDLHMPLLRFPGGQGNWYNWQQGTIETKGRKIFNFMKTGEFRKIFLDDIINISQRDEIQLIYVVNIYDSEEKISSLIKYLLNARIEITGIEIGNELYTKLFIDEIGGPDGYLMKARNALKILRKNGYHGPVGVNLAPEWTPGQEKHVHHDYYKQWNFALQKDGLDDFNSVIVHYYPFVKNLGFFEAIQQGPEHLKTMADEIRKRFPDKKIWMTEWSLGQPVSIPEFNSVLHAIYNLQMNTAIFEAKIELSCYHILAGRGWELIGPDRYTIDYKNDQETKMLRRIPYFAFKMFNEARNGATNYQHRQIDDIEYIIFSSAETASIIGWTTSTHQYHIKLFNHKNFKFTRGTELHAPDLSLSSNGSIVRWKVESSILPWKEKIKISPVKKPEFNGPGIFKFDYKLLKSRGCKADG